MNNNHLGMFPINMEYDVKQAYYDGKYLHLEVYRPEEGTTEDIKINMKVPKEQVTAYSCTQEEYDNSLKHENFMYITTDTQRIYIGNIPACDMKKDKGNKPVENNITCDPKEVMKQYAVYRDSCK